ncbi:saccharopine dehydrogenase [Dehalococcoides mccartyi]|uniref:Saccharopine dehydrogenase n=1 Tax=Dehalococcoides mccartyi TaxID=61435 RepID=A0A2J1DV91_9CHLR|nr:saccharopine dehydrogenase [Dehalococcoides mccartyi]
MTKNILIIGGYGNAGSCIAMLLMQETDARIFLGGRSLEKAKYVAEGLNRLENIQRVEGVRLNVEDPQSLKEAFSGMDIVVVASNTPEYARQIAVAALEAKVDYIDIQYSDRKLHS